MLLASGPPQASCCLAPQQNADANMWHPSFCKAIVRSNCVTFKMNSFSFRIVAVAVLFPFAISVAALPDYTEWAPIQTRSQPVPFAPEFYGQYSDAAHPEIIRSIAAVRRRLLSRSHQAHSESSPFASSPKIASVGSDESQCVSLSRMHMCTVFNTIDRFYVAFSTPVDETTLSVFKECVAHAPSQEPTIDRPRIRRRVWRTP